MPAPERKQRRASTGGPGKQTAPVSSTVTYKYPVTAAERKKERKAVIKSMRFLRQPQQDDAHIRESQKEKQPQSLLRISRSERRERPHPWRPPGSDRLASRGALPRPIALKRQLETVRLLQENGGKAPQLRSGQRLWV